MSKWPACQTCGATNEQFLIPVWEEPADYWTDSPDYIGCTECSTMHEYSNE